MYVTYSKKSIRKAMRCECELMGGDEEAALSWLGEGIFGYRSCGEEVRDGCAELRTNIWQGKKRNFDS